MRLLIILAMAIALLATTSFAGSSRPSNHRVFPVLVDARPAARDWTRPALMAEIASWLAMRPVWVRCLNAWESKRDVTISVFGAAAYVDGDYDERGRWVPRDHAVVAYPICDWFMGLARGQTDGFFAGEVAFSVLVLTHESGHLRGWTKATLDSENEGSTQRWALRHVYAVSRRIGLSHEAAVAVLWYAVKIHMLLPDEYRTEDCEKPYVEDGRLVGCGKSS